MIFCFRSCPKLSKTQGSRTSPRVRLWDFAGRRWGDRCLGRFKGRVRATQEDRAEEDTPGQDVSLAGLRGLSVGGTRGGGLGAPGSPVSVGRKGQGGGGRLEEPVGTRGTGARGLECHTQGPVPLPQMAVPPEP